MFGDWGGLILQFSITAIAILVLIGIVYWLVRRYSVGGLGRIGRGRVPRLAVIDAMAIDGRRRLVLVRRDNMEHLLLIGGPSDVVVEPAIQRPRRPAQKPQTLAPAADAETTAQLPAPPDNPPIPFPQSRVQQPASAPSYGAEVYSQPAPMPPMAQAVPQQAAAAFAPAAQPIERPYTPMRRQPQTAAATVVQFEPPIEQPHFEAPPVEIATAATATGHLNGTNGQMIPDFGISTPASPWSSASASAAEDTAAKVNDLEREMARLLGEITKRQS